MNLPPLRGTPAQVKWASIIRNNTLKVYPAGSMPDNVEDVDDSTWWIANRDRESKMQCLMLNFKPPAPSQYAKGSAARGETPTVSEVGEKHDAELFAASVSRHPEMAELAVLATFSRLYKGKEAARFRKCVEDRLGSLREGLIEAIDRDIDGIRRILGKK